MDIVKEKISADKFKYSAKLEIEVSSTRSEKTEDEVRTDLAEHFANLLAMDFLADKEKSFRVILANLEMGEIINEDK